MNTEGLLFYLSGQNGFEADFARGEYAPTFADEVEIINGGVRDKAFCCGDFLKFAYRAPGNIYAARGTVSFFWRSRYPAGPTAFPVFRVGYADHSSWDACFLRIDYNGSGFEAFVTDINLARTRVSARLHPFPAPEAYTHIAAAWDENWGLKLYINGEPAAVEYRPGVYFAGLDHFGPHQRIVSNWQIKSEYNFIRGGDICELSIYDRMLEPEYIALLSRADMSFRLQPMTVNLRNDIYAAEWRRRMGVPNIRDYPPEIPASAVVRKIEIHDAYDLKRWYWKALDGIRETTWPGVYNRSRLKGRNDYFQLPDWDCYTQSGKSLTLFMPEEPYNHIEISGSACGLWEEEDGYGRYSPIFTRKHPRERTFHRLHARTGGKLRFTNTRQEEPIGDISVFYIAKTRQPAGQPCCLAAPAGELEAFIAGCYPEYERGRPDAFPIRHFEIRYPDDKSRGLDGLVLRLKGVKYERKLAVSVQIKDPLWYYRNLLHFNFSWNSVLEQEIFFDTRDRILPWGKSLWIVISCSEEMPDSFWKEITAELVWKPAGEAKKEHIADRFIQMKDCYAHLVEEQPDSEAYNLFNRFYGDIMDLMRVDPKHKPGQFYYYDKLILRRIKMGLPELPGCPFDYLPDYQIAEPPEGVPDWAFQQIQYLRHYKALLRFYIDERQIEDGEFGGGLSDDGDYTDLWAALIALGSEPEKVKSSLLDCLEAFYKQGMFTNGLPSIQTDELHSAEEGLVTLSAALTADYGNPLLLERAMQTARAIPWLTGINKNGERLFKSSYFNGSKIAAEQPWNLQWPFSPLCISPVAQLIRYNGSPEAEKYWLELADTLIRHYNEATGHLHTCIRYEDGKEMYNSRKNMRIGVDYLLPYTAFRFTGDRGYLKTIPKRGVFGHVPPRDFDEAARRYRKLNFLAGVFSYYNTHGHPWIDRMAFDTLDIQHDRLGGAVFIRNLCVYPTNRVSWEFGRLGDDERIAILFKNPVDGNSSEDNFELSVYNISGKPIEANMIGEEVQPGTWLLWDGDESREIIFERRTAAAFLFKPGQTDIKMTFIREGIPYRQRCDLGISEKDISFYPHGMNVTVHSLGAAASPECRIILKSADGMELKSEIIPPLSAPDNLYPVTWDIIFNLHGIHDLTGCTVEIDPDNLLCEITRQNNFAKVGFDFDWSDRLL